MHKLMKARCENRQARVMEKIVAFGRSRVIRLKAVVIGEGVMLGLACLSRPHNSILGRKAGRGRLDGDAKVLL